MKKGRKIPKIDRNTIGPEADEPILKFYEGFFDTVFISLSPFVQLLDSSTLTFENFFDEDYPHSDKHRILKNTKPISWKEMMMFTGFENIKKIDIALRTSILGLVEEKRDLVLEDILRHVMEKNQIIQPTEGRFQDNQINFILKSIKKLGYDWICLGSEFGDLMELVWIDDLVNDNIELNLHRNLYTYDRKLLISSHWDSFQTYICSERQLVHKIVQNAYLEGFYANQNSEVYWSLKEG